MQTSPVVASTPTNHSPTSSGASTAAPSRNADLAALGAKYLYGNYRPAPIAFVSGHGCELVDADGQRWLDLCAGVAVCSVGHAHPTYVKAISDQVGRVAHVSNWFLNEQNVLAAAALCERTGMDRAFFCNSGAEANEAMLKLARHHFFGKGQPARQKIIAFHNSFHGRTLGALAMTGTPKYHEGFGPMTGVTHVAYGDLDAVKRAMADDVAGINVEPIQGEGGVFPAPAGFLAGLREVCDASGALLMLDEVQTGVGRLGTFLGADASGVKGDVVALAKGVGGGFPVGVMLTREKYAGALPPGTHGTTFGGNPLACAAILAVLEILDKENLLAGVKAKGERLGEGLKAIAAEYPEVCESARGEGLLWGLVLRQGFVAREVLPKVLAHHVLLTGAGERVIRFCPPLTVKDKELDEGLAALRAVVADLAKTAAK
jgi:acetylornithine/N-succinyldiaminopimelate aminotransferase